MSLEEQVNGEYHKGTHDKIVKKVVQRLEESGLYDIIKHNVNYDLVKSKKFGEADVLAQAGDRAFAFEIKSSYKGYKKAEHQLQKDERLLLRECGQHAKVYKFHVYGSDVNYRRIK